MFFDIKELVYLDNILKNRNICKFYAANELKYVLKVKKSFEFKGRSFTKFNNYVFICFTENVNNIDSYNFLLSIFDK